MKVVLAGAFGKLGSDILKELVKQGHEVTALDLITKDIPEISGKYNAIQIDVTKPETLKPLFLVITISTMSSPAKAKFPSSSNLNLQLIFVPSLSL